ncbi:MAG: hypothetical protein LBV78_09865, partial [Kitasatospora sp.]|nr:hypothetical protein [Kitasatospora sp.]
FEALEPGVDVELPDADVWIAYYSSRSSGSSPRGHAITAVAEAEGIRPTKALEVAENPTALRAAILADPATADAARHALLDRLEDDPELQQKLARDVAQIGDMKQAVAAEARTADRVDFVRQVLETGEVKTPSGQLIPAPEAVLEEARQHLSLLEGLEDGEEPGGYVQDAHSALTHLVAEAVESDPQLRAHERRARFQAKVKKAAKAFEELTLDDAAEVYEEELLEQLEGLQQAIAACIAQLREVPTPATGSVDGGVAEGADEDAGAAPSAGAEADVPTPVDTPAVDVPAPAGETPYVPAPSPAS